jgi:hypothetical protein
MSMTKTLFDPVLYLVQQLAEGQIALRSVDHTDNEGEPCQHCQMGQHVNNVTVYGFDDGGERTTADCCVYCIPAVAAEYFDSCYGVRAEVGR